MAAALLGLEGCQKALLVLCSGPGGIQHPNPLLGQCSDQTGHQTPTPSTHGWNTNDCLGFVVLLPAPADGVDQTFQVRSRWCFFPCKLPSGDAVPPLAE